MTTNNNCNPWETTPEYTIELNEQGPVGKQGERGEDGFSPTITVYQNDEKNYILNITNKNGAFLTPNLYGPKEWAEASLINTAIYGLKADAINGSTLSVGSIFHQAITDKPYDISIDGVLYRKVYDGSNNITGYDIMPDNNVDTISISAFSDPFTYIELSNTNKSATVWGGEVASVRGNNASLKIQSSGIEFNGADVELAKGSGYKVYYHENEIATLNDIPNVDNLITSEELTAELAKKQNTLVQGDNITLTPNEDGTVTISSTGGGGVVPDNLVTLNTQQTITGSKTFSTLNVVTPNAGSFIFGDSGTGPQMQLIQVGNSSEIRFKASDSTTKKLQFVQSVDKLTWDGNEVATVNQIPDTTNFITKDVNDLTNYTLTSDLATVATTGSYNDLTDKPSDIIYNAPLKYNQGQVLASGEIIDGELQSGRVLSTLPISFPKVETITIDVPFKATVTTTTQTCIRFESWSLRTVPEVGNPTTQDIRSVANNACQLLFDTPTQRVGWNNCNFTDTASLRAGTNYIYRYIIEYNQENNTLAYSNQSGLYDETGKTLLTVVSGGENNNKTTVWENDFGRIRYFQVSNNPSGHILVDEVTITLSNGTVIKPFVQKTGLNLEYDSTLGLTEDGKLTVLSSGGDVTQAGNNTFTGTNTFNNTATFNGTTKYVPIIQSNGVIQIGSTTETMSYSPELNLASNSGGNKNITRLQAFASANNPNFQLIGYTGKDTVDDTNNGRAYQLIVDTEGLKYFSSLTGSESYNIYQHLVDLEDTVTELQSTIQNLTSRIQALETNINGGNA